MLQAEEERKKQWLIMMVKTRNSVYNVCGLVGKGVLIILNMIWTGYQIVGPCSPA